MATGDFLFYCEADNEGFSLFFLKKPQKDDTGYIFLKYENFYLKIIDKLNE